MRNVRPLSRSVAAMVLWCPAVLVAFNGCSARMMPAPKVPEKTIPELAQPAEPPDQGEGQVVIDTTNGPATVQVTLFGNSAWAAPICATTPCAANLPLGTYNVVFKGRNDPTLEDKEILQVGRAPTVLRHTIGSTKSSYGLYFGGLIAVTVGAIVLGMGLLSLSSDVASDGTVYGSIAVGALLTGGGAWAMYSGRPEITPGSSVQWAPNGPAPAGPAPAPGEKRQVLRITPTGFVVSFN